MDSIVAILDLLKDGEWHMLEEIQRNVKIDRIYFQRVIGFLREYHFIIVHKTEETVRLEKIAQKFLACIVNS